MLVNSGETYEIKYYKRKENSPYLYENIPDGTFKCRPAGTLEKRTYRMQSGVDTGTDSNYIYATRMPKDIKDGDRVEFLGKMWTVSSVGYYLDQSRIVNASVLSEEQIIERCPKGLTIQ